MTTYHKVFAAVIIVGDVLALVGAFSGVLPVMWFGIAMHGVGWLAIGKWIARTIMIGAL